MGIYYSNRLYYGRIMRKTFYTDNVDGKRLPQGLELFYINEDRLILFSKMESIDDGVSDIKLVPDYFSKSNLLKLNCRLTEDFFKEEEEVKKKFKDFIGEDPFYYMACYESTTYSKECHLLYNIIVDLNR